MNIIKYNDVETHQERSEVKNVTLEEAKNVIKILNEVLEEAISNELITNEEIEKIQKFVYHYENLDHHKSTTVGLYATDKEELANKEEFFQITF